MARGTLLHLKGHRESPQREIRQLALIRQGYTEPDLAAYSETSLGFVRPNNTRRDGTYPDTNSRR